MRDLQRSGTGFQVDLGRWRLDGTEPLVRARELPVARPGLGINVGNPHVVVALADEDELAGIDLTVIPILEPEAPEGANVEFVLPHEPLVHDGVGRIRMRVHERGSGETLSCGTGAVAAALAVRHWAGAGAPNEWRVDVPGGPRGRADVPDGGRRARGPLGPGRARLRRRARPGLIGPTAPNSELTKRPLSTASRNNSKSANDLSAYSSAQATTALSNASPVPM